MKCKTCGGGLLYKDGIYICDSCASKFSVSEYYNDSEAFLLYIENDKNGRRSKSSIIAQDIFNKIDSKKIKLFYPRDHISNLAGDEYSKAYNSALAASKVIIVLGTVQSEFRELIEQYSSFFEGKSLLPIYCDMDAYEIPKELNGIQALPYDKVGAINDLERNILRILGKADEYDVLEVSSKTLTKKKKTKIIVSLGSGFLILISVLYIVFGTPLVLQSKKYEHAQKLSDEGNFAKAADILYDLGDYKESKNLLIKIYTNYKGYYQDEAKKLSFYFNVSNDLKGNLELTKLINGKQVKISEAFEMMGNTVDLSFNDSENNQGTITLILFDDRINVTVDTTDKNSELYIEKTDLEFEISKKSDKPFAKEVSKKDLIDLLKERPTLRTLKQKGLELEFSGPLYKDTAESKYTIKNTDISFAIINYEMTIGNDPKKVDDPILYAVSAPAKLLIPEKVGSKATPFIEDDIMYVPCGTLTITSGYVFDFGILDQFEGNVISEDSNVCIAYRNSVGEEIWSAWKNLYIKNDISNADTVTSDYDGEWISTTSFEINGSNDQKLNIINIGEKEIRFDIHYGGESFMNVSAVVDSSGQATSRLSNGDNISLEFSKEKIVVTVGGLFDATLFEFYRPN